MLSDLSDKINYLMTMEGISGLQLAQKIGLPASTIKKIRSKEITNPTLATIIPIARYFSISLDYLLDNNVSYTNAFQSRRQHYNLPIIQWNEIDELPNISLNQYPTFVSQYDYGANAFVLVVEANDWIVFPLDSHIIIAPTAISKHRDYVLVKKSGSHQATIKQFLCEEDQSYLCSLSIANNIAPFTLEYQLLPTFRSLKGEVFLLSALNGDTL